jgi:1,4-alpha-glucan branching enzyme
MQVWSRFEGYPGDGAYLEFHKMRWPGGLKLWRVSGAGVDLGAKEAYDPGLALDRARGHAAHFAGILGGIAGAQTRRDGVVVAPFDTELFGHWWAEGPDFLDAVYQELRGRPEIRPSTGSQHLLRNPGRPAIRMPAGSWGANGDFSMWLSEQTAWTWQRLWPLEEQFWDVAPAALGSDDTRFIVAQAARELLLAQSSDWQFIISTGAAADYGERRFREHCADTEELVRALVDGSPAALERAHRRAAELAERDALFPDVLPALAAALAGSRSLVLG